MPAAAPLSGQTVEAFAASVAHARLLSIGLNCAYGARQLMPYLERLAAVAETRISAHPNAGLPNVMGGYDETPEMFAEDVGEYMRRGLVNIVGGCCGTHPGTHLRTGEDRRPLYAAPVARTASRNGARRAGAPAGGPRGQLHQHRRAHERRRIGAKFARLIREGNYEEALRWPARAGRGRGAGRRCLHGRRADRRARGDADVPQPDGFGTRDRPRAGDDRLVEVGGTRRRDSKVTQGKSVVNSISLKEGEAEFLRRAAEIHRYGAAAVVMLFDERGQADTSERKIEVAERAYRLLTENGFPAEDIVFDPQRAGRRHGNPRTRRIRQSLYRRHTLDQGAPAPREGFGRRLELSFAFRGNNAVREAMHSAFLYHAIRAGMDMGIVNPQMLRVYSEIEPELLARVEDVILCRRADAAERLTEYAQRCSRPPDRTQAPDAWRAGPLEERIDHAMLKGVADYIEQDALEGYEALGSPMAVIDTLLMPAMERVGALFGEGKMFLPRS